MSASLTNWLKCSGGPTLLSPSIACSAVAGEREEIIRTMIFVRSIWTLEIDGKPTLAFEAKKYREANEICHQEWLRVELSQQKNQRPPVVPRRLRLKDTARPAG